VRLRVMAEHQAEVTVDRDDSEDTTIYKVVVNHEEQYSIWPEQGEPPRCMTWARGHQAGVPGYIGEVWTDMRP